MKIKELINKHYFLSIILTVLIFGLAGGIVGGIVGQTYLSDISANLAPFGDLNFSTGKYKDQGIIISNAKNVIVRQDAKIDETINSAGGSLVGIYKKQKAGKPGGAFALDNFYKLSDSIGQGIIITSDGWIATSLALDKIYNDCVVITNDKKIYQIDKAAADNLTKFYFIHVPARDLSVRKFALSQDIKRGGLVVAVNWQGLSWISSAAGFSQNSSLVQSSDNFSKKLALNDKIPAEFKGSVIFNLAGDVMGIVDSQGAIELASRLNGAVKSLFKSQAAARPSLGVNYLDLTRLAESGNQHGYWRKGALIYKDQKGMAVQKGGAADKAGLREGDIIVAVDNVGLDQDNDLADIIQNHLAGDTINLSIFSQGQEKQIVATLGELK